MTVSTPVRIVALAGLLVALAGGDLLALRIRHHTSPAPVAVRPVATTPATTTTATTTRPTTPAPTHARPALHLDPSLPPPVRDVLEHSRRAVVLVYSASSATDRTLRDEVAAGAQAAGVPFVPLNVDRNSVAAAVFGWTSAAADPETFVVRRPGTIAFRVLGMTDATPIEQAIASAR